MSTRLDTTVLVFARRPRAGQVKRRLAHAIGRRAAAARYAALLTRTLAVVDAVAPAARLLLAATPADVAYFRRRLAGTSWRVRAQAAGNLGTRMAVALAQVHGNGGSALLIGSDLLDIRPQDLRNACAALAATSDVVVGPTHDGGYWLIGARAPHPELFRAMVWSHASVCSVTASRCAAARLRFTMLAPWRADLDGARDLLCGRGARMRERSSKGCANGALR